MNVFFNREFKRKKKISTKLQLWRLKQSEVKMFAEKVNKSCDGNEDWHGLNRKFLDFPRKVCR